MGNLTAAAVGPQGQLYQTSDISNIANHPWTQINPVTRRLHHLRRHRATAGKIKSDLLFQWSDMWC